MIERLKPVEELAAVAEVRGVGLMLGVELAEDRDAAPVAAGALEQGVVVRASGRKVVMSPPFVIEEEQADRVVDVLAEELRKL
jgi:adenosylmethionine-8-amino-7-oxononanoate aminotransferase